MNRLLAIAAISALNVSLIAPGAWAQGGASGTPACLPGSKACSAPVSSAPAKATTKNATKTAQVKLPPKPGASGRDGRPFQQASNSRFPTPPKGQQYRVVQDNLVLVDSKTMTIIKVLGLLDTLTR